MHNHEPTPLSNSVAPPQQEEDIRALLVRLLRLVAAEVVRVLHEQTPPSSLQGADPGGDTDSESDS